MCGQSLEPVKSSVNYCIVIEAGHILGNIILIVV